MTHKSMAIEVYRTPHGMHRATVPDLAWCSDGYEEGIDAQNAAVAYIDGFWERELKESQEWHDDPLVLSPEDTYDYFSEAVYRAFSLTEYSHN